jgi:hypothetical protein
MLSQIGPGLYIGLAPDCAALITASRWQRRRISVLEEHRFVRDLNPESLAQQLGRLLEAAAVRGRSANLILSDELVRMWTVKPPAGATCMADLVAAAELRFQSLFGHSTSGWNIAADWDAERTFLAVAMPLALQDELERNARAHRIHLIEIVPQFVAALNGWRGLRRKGAWFGAIYSDVLTLAVFNGDDLVAVRTGRLPSGVGREWLDSFLEREAWRFGLGLPALLQLGGEVPQPWQSQKGRLESECTLLSGGAKGDTVAVRLACTGIAK